MRRVIALAGTLFATVILFHIGGELADRTAPPLSPIPFSGVEVAPATGQDYALPQAATNYADDTVAP